MDRIDRYVDRLLRQRRPDRFVPTDEEAEAIAAAIALRAADEVAALPDPAFVAGLRQRLTASPESVAGSGRPTPGPVAGSGQRLTAGRRGLVFGVTGAAAAAAAGIVAGYAIPHGDGGSGGQDPTLDPADGRWQAVVSSADLADGATLAFDTGTVSGFVTRTGATLSARSGVCTHQGCHLRLNAAERRLDCPCHRTFFALDGQVVHSQLPTPPARLPAISVRERAGTIEVLT
jgi:cytochrome b6-f complex iron-sulfur subunit